MIALVALWRPVALLNDLLAVLPRHGVRRRHPRLLLLPSAKTWMPTAVGMTVRRIDHESRLLAVRISLRDLAECSWSAASCVIGRPSSRPYWRSSYAEAASSAAACGIGQTAISTMASSRIIVALRADVEASRASHQQDGFAAVTTNSGASSALDLACANMFPPLRGAFSTCVGQPSRSAFWAFWKPPERKALQAENCSPRRLES